MTFMNLSLKKWWLRSSSAIKSNGGSAIMLLRLKEKQNKNPQEFFLHQMAEITQDLGAGGDKSHKNRMKAMFGGGCFQRSAALSDGSASSWRRLIRSWPAA